MIISLQLPCQCNPSVNTYIYTTHVTHTRARTHNTHIAVLSFSIQIKKIYDKNNLIW